MRRSHYRVILIPAVVCMLVISSLAFYATGVIDRSAARALIGERLEIVCDALDSKMETSRKLTEEIYNNYRSRARVVSMMLSKNRSIISDESSLEELRVAIGADVISISDESGKIKYSSDMSSEEISVLEEFMPAIDNKVFSEAVISEVAGKNVVVTGSSRLDEAGVIQIRFSVEEYQQQLDMSKLSTAVTSIPIMRGGHLAVIDEETYTFISHTDSYLDGSAVQFPREEFSDESGWFSSVYEGKKVMVKYQKHDNMIALGIVPYTEVYKRRNAVTKWVIFSMSALSGITLLSMRNYVIRKTPKLSQQTKI